MDKKELMNTAWKGFREGAWMDGINVRNFIQKNYTLYEGGRRLPRRHQPEDESRLGQVQRPDR